MINLNNITLLGISDATYLHQTVKAIRYCAKKCNFYDIILLTNENNVNYNDINIIKIYRDFDLAEYARICINEVYKYIKSDFCLFVQWDGFIINEYMWNDNFLKYDYIGAPWGFPQDCKNRVGNGGFSLRSKKFLNSSSKIQYDPFNYDVYFEEQRIDRKISPEDWFLCYHSYEKLLNENIKFAPIDVAYSFSVEHPSYIKSYNRDKIETYKSFGFHGNFNNAAMKILE